MTTPTGGADSYTQGINWSNSSGDVTIYQSDGGLNLLAGASSRKTFTGSGPTYASPADSYFVLTHDTTNSLFVLTNQTNNMRWTFSDLSNSNISLRGLLKEQSTLQLYSQGKSGYVYSYNTNGTINQITTPTGQNYNIVFTYAAGAISQIQVKDASGNLLEQVNYTYYENVTSPSTDLGKTGDLVQVQVSKKATTDTGSTLSIVRYTQYRYDSNSHLKAVFKNDAIQRILTSTGLSTPTAILSQANSYGTPVDHELCHQELHLLRFESSVH